MCQTFKGNVSVIVMNNPVNIRVLPNCSRLTTNITIISTI